MVETIIGHGEFVGVTTVFGDALVDAAPKSETFWVLGVRDSRAESGYSTHLLGWHISVGFFGHALKFGSLESARAGAKLWHESEVKERREWDDIRRSRFPRLLAWWRDVDLSEPPEVNDYSVLKITTALAIELEVGP